MSELTISNSMKSFAISSYAANEFKQREDLVSIEEPLEIRIGVVGDVDARQVAVTMRTPGNDAELAAGFLFTEDIISSPEQLEKIEVDPDFNLANVWLKQNVTFDPKLFERHSFVASSCGVCGKKSIDAVRVKSTLKCQINLPIISTELINSLPALLKSSQSNFAQTGGLHASGLFDETGALITLREDVGRHNALDKLLGERFLKGSLPLQDKILMVSGRASFELVQKAAHAGIPILAAVGAPSSLAIELAHECKMTLLGFVRDDRFNVYSGAHRIASNR
jgi:FdhD protein